MTKKLLILIVILAFLVRVYRPSYPPLLWDEAALGYNSYSILKTGADEYGHTLPLILKSFGDYKPALYSYLALPFIAVFGLTPLAVRLPSIILGSLMPLLMFLILKKTPKLGLISTAVLAFNPYNIHFSRGAWETNILTFELLLTSLLFFRSRHFLSALVFGLSLYTYQGAKLISLLLILILFGLYFRQLKIKKIFLQFFFPLFILALPIVYNLFFNSAGNRLQVASIFSYPPPADTPAIVYYPQQILLRYFNHFSPRFLAFQGDWQNPRHSAPYTGVILYPSLILFVLGIFHKSKLSTFFLLWLLAAPLPAAFTRDQIQAVRSMSLSIPLVYFTALGIYKLKNSRFFSLLLATSYLLSFIYYLDLYYNHLVKTNPNDWLYGYRQASQHLISNQSQYQHLYFTNFYGQPYIYYLFYSQYPPAKYQAQAKLTTSGIDTGTINQIDNIKFASTPHPQSLPPNSLAIYSHDELLRFGLNPQDFQALAPINHISTFYAYQN